MADPLFRLLWAEEALASISEQLFIVCLTLLVLDLTGPGAALGLVLAAAAVPRAMLLIFGGVPADRVDPARVVVASTWLRTLVLGGLAALVVFGPPPIIVIAALAALLGGLDGACYPASLALLPKVVPPAGLTRANALVQGAESAGDPLGPVLAAGIVGALGLGSGLGLAATLHLLGAIVLTAFARRVWRPRTVAGATMTPTSTPVAATTDTPTAGQETTLRPEELRGGLRFVWTQPVIRSMLLALAILNVAVVGPIFVRGAVLAEQRLGGAAALGTIFIGFGTGSLLGLLAAGARTPRRRGPVLIAGTALIGAGTTAFGFVDAIVPAMAAAAVIGLGSGYLGVVLVAWLQELVPEHLRGRVMSLVVLAVVAFDPLSYVLPAHCSPPALPARSSLPAPWSDSPLQVPRPHRPFAGSPDNHRPGPVRDRSGHVRAFLGQRLAVEDHATVGEVVRQPVSVTRWAASGDRLSSRGGQSLHRRTPRPAGPGAECGTAHSGSAAGPWADAPLRGRAGEPADFHRRLVFCPR